MGTAKFLANRAGADIDNTIVLPPDDVIASSAVVAAGANNQTLTGVAGKWTYISGFEVTGGGATATSAVTINVTGASVGTLSYSIQIPVGASTNITPLLVRYDPPIRAATLGGNIVLNVPSFGTGNTASAVTVRGMRI